MTNGYITALLVVVALVAPLNAQDMFSYTDEITESSGKRVCFPAQWEGGMAMYMPKKDVYIRSKVAFDTPRKRIASDARIQHGRHSFHLKAIVDWNAGKRYFIYKLKGKLVCRAHKLRSRLPAKSNCLPSKFRSLGGYYIGTGKNSINLRAYGLFSKGLVNVVRLTEDNVPVRDSLFYSKKGALWKEKSYASASWFNISAGVHNKFFSVPKACHKNLEDTVFEHVSILGVHHKSKAIDNMFHHIKQFEANHKDAQVEKMHIEMPSGAAHVMHSGISHIVEHATSAAKKWGVSLDDLFTKM